MLDKFKVGNIAVLRSVTEDEDLNDFIETFGDRVYITDIEDDNFWGVNVEHEYSIPYHMEYKDISHIEETDEETRKKIEDRISHYEDVEKCSFCGEFFVTYELNSDGRCDSCERAWQEH